MTSPAPQRRQQMSELEMFEVLQALFPGELQDDCNYDRLDEIISEKFEVGIDEFCNIASHLIYLTPKLKSALGGKTVHAFGLEGVGNDSFFIAMMKREAAQ